MTATEIFETANKAGAFTSDVRFYSDTKAFVDFQLNLNGAKTPEAAAYLRSLADVAFDDMVMDLSEICYDKVAEDLGTPFSFECVSISWTEDGLIIAMDGTLDAEDIADYRFLHEDEAA